jgi:hypothetical protein
MATIEEIAAGLRSGTPVQKPTTATQTFDPKYINSYGDLIKNTTDPNLVSKLNTYGQVTDAYGNPLFDQNVFSAVNSPDKKIAEPANKAIQTTLGTWADEVLQKDTLDTITGQPINWNNVGGTSGKQYQAAKTALINNPANNVRWATQQTQAQTIAQKAIDDAKTAQDLQIAKDAKATADAAADAVATKLATEQDTANQLAQQTANDLKLKNATAPLDTKTLGGGFDALGNPINSTVTSGITQDMIDKGMLNVAKVGAPTTIVNPNSAADVTKMVDAAKAAEVNVTPDSMVSNQLSGLLAKNNPYIQQAVNAANLQASRRGMLNTGAAAGFAQDAAIKAALPIAQQDALARQKANEANAAAQNQLLNTGLGLKATSMDRQAQNDIQVQNWNAANKIAVDTTNTQAINAATNLFTTAMLNNLNDLSKSNVENGQELNRLITSGNITIASKAADAVIAELAADKKVESDKKLALFTETLKQQTNQLNAENEAILETLKNDQASFQNYMTYKGTLDAELLNGIRAINLTPDMSEAAKSANANNLITMNNAMVNSALKTTLARSQLVNSDAGKTATDLVSPTKK